MMDENRTFWLYLEPYSFIFKGYEKALVYNTLNSAYIICPYNNLFLCTIIDALEDPDNGYCVLLGEEEMNDKEVASWIKQLCISFSGNVVPVAKKKPFIMKPICKIYDTVGRMEKDDTFFFGRNILVNLNEVSLYLPYQDFFSLQKKHVVSYYKQFLYNYPFADNKLEYTDYALLLAKLSAARVSKVNIFNANHYACLNDILKVLTDCSFKKCFYLDSSISLDEAKQMYLDKETEFIIYWSAHDDEPFMEQKIAQFKDLPVNWRFIVTSEKDILIAEHLQDKLKVSFSFMPYFNGNNIAFFKDFVFNGLEDIIGEPISKKTIFRRQTLNENFFGKLIVLPSGDVYANVNCPPVGNILFDSVAKLVYEEMTNSTAWFMLRNAGECNDCINRHLCPSISNYELVTGIMNMCYIRGDRS